MQARASTRPWGNHDPDDSEEWESSSETFDSRSLGSVVDDQRHVYGNYHDEGPQQYEEDLTASERQIPPWEAKSSGIYAPSVRDPASDWPGRAPTFYGRQSSGSMWEQVSEAVTSRKNRRKVFFVVGLLGLILIVGLATGIPISKRNQAAVESQNN
ncbi:hypothetical protein HDU93_005353, partial [Gonapodya sp. JEL0774]